ncbi:MAG: signal peptide peptidase SppA [Bacteroidales bacterium]|nr:signal peptide peptidase SppA [Bacteroidales bacterium]
MKSFFKYLLATITGIILSSILLFLIFMAIVSAMISRQDKELDIKENTVLYLKLDQPIIDREPEFPIDLSSLTKNQVIGLNVLLDNIEKAKSDDKIAGIHLDLLFLRTGIATIEEIRNALIDFRESGKFVTVYSEALGQGAYYLASAADEIYLNPLAYFNIVGLKAQTAFFKNTLKKLDIETTIVRAGNYKSYGERFTEDKYTKENREQIERIINTVWDDILIKVSKERDITPDQLKNIADDLLLKNSNSAYDYNLVDSIIYKDQVISILKSKTGTPEKDDLRIVRHAQYKHVPKPKGYKGLARDKIAVIYASGGIDLGEGDDQSIGSDRFCREIRKARRDSSVKAIVLRVNSPGGSGTASEAIWRELDLAREAKPVVVSMGDLAGSGGYYIACMADSILAHPSTITGSIGVFGLIPNAEGLFNKMGITFDEAVTNKHADLFSGLNSPDAEEIQYLQGLIDGMYDTFVSRVSKGRNLNTEEVKKIAQGRIWSGVDAKEIKLVDKYGGLHDAINVAKSMAGLGDKYRIVELPEQEDPIEKLIKDLTGNAKLRAIEKKLGIDAGYAETVMEFMKSFGVNTRMPVDIKIY